MGRMALSFPESLFVAFSKKLLPRAEVYRTIAGWNARLATARHNDNVLKPRANLSFLGAKRFTVAQNVNRIVKVHYSED
jgi:hypothetical protein